ncbi:hypothetical protein QTP70_013514 [Hemibagrus guttatus]|uniref:Uncharacterized protein n=1 Tax=Hemibagrus guttatus TaxID=175788 RepID=A0AAE0QE57_9TELE|nr:hypothetical protein QTP70_013514 [Hemibagrus guttatus]
MNNISMNKITLAPNMVSERYATNFYKDLYKSDCSDNMELLDVFYRALPKDSPEDNAALEGPLVLEELQAALNSMAGGKAAGN